MNRIINSNHKILKYGIVIWNKCYKRKNNFPVYHHI